MNEKPCDLFSLLKSIERIKTFIEKGFLKDIEGIEEFVTNFDKIDESTLAENNVYEEFLTQGFIDTPDIYFADSLQAYLYD